MHSRTISLHVLRITQNTTLCGPNHWFKTPTIRLRWWHLMTFLTQLSFHLYSTCILQ